MTIQISHLLKNRFAADSMDAGYVDRYSHLTVTFLRCGSWAVPDKSDGQQEDGRGDRRIDESNKDCHCVR